jgi:hypothetical protein
MTTSERSTIRLRLLGADYPDGEIPLANLGAIAERAQQLATRLARAEEGRGGPGRSPNRLAEGVRLMFLGIESGSTQLLIAAPPRDPQLDLGPATEEAIERTLGRLIDGLDAAATGDDLPDGYDDLSRRALADWLDALAQAAPSLEAEGRVGARPTKNVRLQPATARERLRQVTAPPPSPAAITVEGVLYAVDLLNGRYRIEDDMGSRIDLVTTIFTAEDIRPLLAQRVVATGTPEYNDAGRIREVEATTITPAEEIPGLDPSRFWRNVELDELLRSAEPLRSIDHLAIPGLTEDEGDAFLRALRE